MSRDGKPLLPNEVEIAFTCPVTGERHIAQSHSEALDYAKAKAGKGPPYPPYGKPENPGAMAKYRKWQRERDDYFLEVSRWALTTTTTGGCDTCSSTEAILEIWCEDCRKYHETGEC